MQKNSRGTCKIDKNVPQLSESLFVVKESDLNLKVLNSQQKSNVYHFKVMQLRNYEDTRTCGDCKVRFHFFFELFRRKKHAYLEEFEWDINDNPQQFLYLSRDTKRLMEVVNNFTATVYYRVNVDEQGLVDRLDTKKQVVLQGARPIDDTTQLPSDDNG